MDGGPTQTITLGADANAGALVTDINSKLVGATASLAVSGGSTLLKLTSATTGSTSSVAVSGGSAGGYLTLVTGYRVKPWPKALVAFWGYGDLVGPWYSEPSPHPRHHHR